MKNKMVKKELLSLEGKKVYKRLSEESRVSIDTFKQKLDIGNSEAIYLILNDLENPKTCKFCNTSKCNMVRGPLRYRDFCSSSCKNKWILENTNIKEKISKKAKENEKEFKKTGEKYKQAEKRLKTLEEKGKILPFKEKKDFEQYKILVDKCTNKNNLNILSNYRKRGRADLKEDYYHLDHKYSKKEGFINNIPPFIIGSIYNLEFIKGTFNLSKQSLCSISKEELLRCFYE